MNVELNFAIEELELRSYDRKWFIPIKLTKCEIPARPIGGKETLKDLQYIDFSENILEGLAELLRIVTPIVSPIKHAEMSIEILLKMHINNKIEYFKNKNALCLPEIEKRWLGLLEENTFEQIKSVFSTTFNRMKNTNRIENDRIIEDGNDGRVILLSISPEINYQNIFKSLEYKNKITRDTYIDFIIEGKKFCRELPNWQQRDLVHIIFCQNDKESEIDLLYLLNFELYLSIYSYLYEENKKGNKVMPIEQIYPTNLIDIMGFEKMMRIISQEDAKEWKS
jgi:hypothetical protein